MIYMLKILVKKMDTTHEQQKNLSRKTETIKNNQMEMPEGERERERGKLLNGLTKRLKIVEESQ